MTSKDVIILVATKVCIKVRLGMTAGAKYTTEHDMELRNGRITSQSNRYLINNVRTAVGIKHLAIDTEKFQQKDMYNLT